MDFEEYKRKLLEEDERNRLSELQTKYNGMGTPNYSSMSLHDQLQTRFDLNELNELQNKYGVQQTSLQPTTGFGSSTTPVPDYLSALKIPSATTQPNYNITPQSTYTPPTQPTQPVQTKPYGWSYLLQKLNPISTANAAEYKSNSQTIDYSKYGEGFSKEYIDEMHNDAKFQNAFQRTSLNEGGYNNDPVDRGGQTNFGISKKWYPNEDIENLTKERAQAIYYRDYWLKHKINQLPQELSEVVFDNGVVQGQSQAIKNLQRALNIKVDGIIGPQTIEALHNLNDYNIIREKIKNNARNVEEQNQQAHPNQRRFYKGHMKRFNSY